MKRTRALERVAGALWVALIIGLVWRHLERAQYGDAIAIVAINVLAGVAGYVAALPPKRRGPPG